jgi:hypothetical protein
MKDIIEVFISLARMQEQAIDRAQEEVKPQKQKCNERLHERQHGPVQRGPMGRERMGREVCDVDV